MKDRYLIIHKGIARWKLNNPFENWLSYKADKSEFWKCIYVLYYQIFDNKYYQGGMKFIDKQLDVFQEHWEGLSRKYVIRDMIYSLHRFGADFQDYWNYDFLTKSAIGKQLWVVDKLRYGYDDILSCPEVIKLVEDKYKCYNEFQHYYKRKAVGCYNNADFEAFEKFVEINRSFIYKPLGADCGRGVKKVTLKIEESKSFFNEHILHGPFIAEEIIRQHEDIGKIHPQSINTVRIATFTINNRVEILATSLRMGVGDSIADNAGSGGIFASIDSESGIIVCPATNYKREKYIKHPDTHIIIPGFQIPAWNELMYIVKKSAIELQSKFNIAALISWDFSYSTNGWVIVEINTGGDWIILQAAQKEPLKNKLYKLIDELLVRNE